MIRYPLLGKKYDDWGYCTIIGRTRRTPPVTRNGYKEYGRKIFSCRYWKDAVDAR